MVYWRRQQQYQQLYPQRPRPRAVGRLCMVSTDIIATAAETAMTVGDINIWPVLFVPVAGRWVYLEITSRRMEENLSDLKIITVSQETVIANQKDALDDGRTKIDNLTKDLERLYSTHGRATFGENALDQILQEQQDEGFIKGYELKQKLTSGRVPDAVVDFGGGMKLAIDSKTPLAPSLSSSEDGDVIHDEDRKAYIDKLKSHISQLGDKHYHAELAEDSSSLLQATVLFLPGEQYLQAAYHGSSNLDTAKIHEYAIERKILLVTPTSFRTLVQLLYVLHESELQKQQLAEESTQKTLKELLVLWEGNVIPTAKKMARELEKVVACQNDMTNTILDCNEAFRRELGTKKQRKSQLPKQIFSKILDP